MKVIAQGKRGTVQVRPTLFARLYAFLLLLLLPLAAYAERALVLWANHRGSEGVVKVASATIAEVRGWTITESANTIDDTILSDTAETHQGGTTSWSAQITTFWDETDTSGQMAMTIGASITLTNVTWTGYEADASDSAAIDVTAASGTTTINWSGGTEPTYKTAGATVLVLSTISISFTGFAIGTEIRVFRESDGVEIDGIETTVSTPWVATLSSGVSYRIQALLEGYLYIRDTGRSFTASQTYNLNQRVDLNYKNP